MSGNQKGRSFSVSSSTSLINESFILPENKENKENTRIQDLNQVFLKRFPDESSKDPKFHYEIENKRGENVRVLMTYQGTNISVTPQGSFQKTSSTSVEGTLDSGANVAVATVEAEDKSQNFDFSVAVRVFPTHTSTKETDLEGVKLYTTTSYKGVEGNFVFEVQNPKEFDIEIDLDLQGTIKGGALPPFKKVVRIGERAVIGEVQSDSDISSSWKWTAILPDSDGSEGSTQILISEIKGVTLKQIVTPGQPHSNVVFEIVNTRDKNIEAEIDLAGGEEVNFLGSERPIKGFVGAGQTKELGRISMKGQADVNWKFIETD